jgi:hypothetical protein
MDNTSNILEKLMAYIYDEYNRNDTFKKHGQHSRVLCLGFERASGISLGYAGAQQEYIRLLLKNGWIEMVSIHGDSDPKAKLLSFSRVKPTIAGIKHVEETRQPGRSYMKIATNSAEIIGRFLKGFTGKS